MINFAITDDITAMSDRSLMEYNMMYVSSMLYSSQEKLDIIV